LKAAVQSGLQRVPTVTGTRHIFPKLAIVWDEDTDATLFNLLDPRAMNYPVWSNNSSMQFHAVILAWFSGSCADLEAIAAGQRNVGPS
jgi:hypothetical protein